MDAHENAMISKSCHESFMKVHEFSGTDLKEERESDSKCIFKCWDRTLESDYKSDLICY